MAFLTESDVWVEDLYRIELNDPVEGGEDGVDNLHAKQLGSRTRYLKAIQELLAEDVNSLFTRTADISVFAGFTEMNAGSGRILRFGGESVEVTALDIVVGTVTSTVDLVGTVTVNGSPISGGGLPSIATSKVLGNFTGSNAVAAAVDALATATANAVMVRDGNGDVAVRYLTASKVVAAGDIALRPTGDTVDTLVCAVVSGECKLSSSKNIRIVGTTSILDGTSRSMVNVNGVQRLDCQASSNTLGTTATDLLLNGFSLQASVASADVIFYCGTRKFVVSDYSAGAKVAFRPVTDATSTDATAFTLFSYSPSTTRPSAYEVFVFAENAAGEMKAWHNVFPARGQGGAAAFPGGTSSITGAVLGTPDAALSGAAFLLDVSTTTIRGRATGIAATSLNWTGFVREIH